MIYLPFESKERDTEKNVMLYVELIFPDGWFLI